VRRFEQVHHLVRDDVVEKVLRFLRELRLQADGASTVIAAVPLRRHPLQEVSSHPHAQFRSHFRTSEGSAWWMMRQTGLRPAAPYQPGSPSQQLLHHRLPLAELVRLVEVRTIAARQPLVDLDRRRSPKPAPLGITTGGAKSLLFPYLSLMYLMDSMNRTESLY
jgi:hypothetical protein